MRARGLVLAACFVMLGTSAALFSVGAAWASPPSAITNAFVATIKPAAEAMSLADAAAQTQSGNARIRAFARRDAARQASTLDALEAWAQGIRRDAAAEAAAPTIDHLGPLLYLFSGPAQADVPGSHLTGAERESLARLGTLSGAEFDAAYAATQAKVLRRLLDIYTDYIKNGDDTDLRALAVHERPRVLAAIAQLPRG